VLYTMVETLFFGEKNEKKWPPERLYNTDYTACDIGTLGELGGVGADDTNRQCFRELVYSWNMGSLRRPFSWRYSNY